MPDVTPCLHPGQVRRWISIDQHKFSIVAAVLPPEGGKPEVQRIETTERAIRRLRALKQLLRHGRIFREGKTAWTKLHRAWLARQRLDDPFAQEALEQLLVHVDGIERQLDTLDARLAEIAGSERWAGQVQILTWFRGIATITALGLIAEIGDFHRFSHPRELAAWLGIVPSEYSSGDQQHRGHITLSGNKHARRLLIEAA